MTDDDCIYRIGKFSPQPGEILVFKARGTVSEEALKHLRETVQAGLEKAGCPDQTVWIIDDGLDLMLIDPRDFGPPEDAA